MSNYAVQRRRGTTAQHSSFTGLVGEVTVDTDKDVVVVHDGSLAGGRPGLRTGSTVTDRTVAGHLVPDTDITYDLGSATHQFRSMYVGPGSLYVNGKEVIQDDSGTITVSTTSGQNLQLKTAGTGDIEINPSGTGVCQVKGTLQILTTTRITDSAGTKVEFGDNIDMNSNQINEVADPSAAQDAATKAYVDTAETDAVATANAYTDTQIATEDTLAELNDTNITTPAAASLLLYDTGTSTWRDGAMSGDVTIGDTGVTAIGSVFGFTQAVATNTASTIVARDGSGNFAAGTITATATAAQYSDVAERYESDTPYEAGTVLVFGGHREVTASSEIYDTRVAGIVSSNPAHLMNAEAGTNETHPPLALTGRVPCKVTGVVHKGDLMVTSAEAGVAMAADERVLGTIIGKAIQEHNSSGTGTIEILVALM